MIRRLLPLLVLVAAGCTLPAREYAPVSYYSIDPPLPAPRAGQPADATLAVRPLESASRYGERILYREQGLAVAFHEFERWAERPEEMVGEALRRALEAARVARVVADDRLVRRPDVLVEARLTRFDQVRRTPQWTAECELEFVVKLADGDQVFLGKRLAASRPASEPTVPAFVEAMNAAVGDLVAQVADAVGKTLEIHRDDLRPRRPDAPRREGN